MFDILARDLKLNDLNTIAIYLPATILIMIWKYLK